MATNIIKNIRKIYLKGKTRKDEKSDGESERRKRSVEWLVTYKTIFSILRKNGWRDDEVLKQRPRFIAQILASILLDIKRENEEIEKVRKEYDEKRTNGGSQQRIGMNDQSWGKRMDRTFMTIPQRAQEAMDRIGAANQVTIKDPNMIKPEIIRRPQK